jgi:hypothetical protein
MGKFFLTIGTVIFFITACKAAPKPPPELPWSAPAKAVLEQSYFIVDGKNKGGLADWVSIYLNSGTGALETLSQYGDKFVFVKEVSGAYFNPLMQWLARFSLDRDFPRILAERAESCFMKNAATYPDAEYGGFFELAIKAFSDAHYDSLEKEDDFWIEKYIYHENGADAQRNEFSFFVLITADKTALKAQINAILSGVQPPQNTSKSQLASIESLKTSFFEYF